MYGFDLAFDLPAGSSNADAFDLPVAAPAPSLGSAGCSRPLVPPDLLPSCGGVSDRWIDAHLGSAGKPPW